MLDADRQDTFYFTYLAYLTINFLICPCCHSNNLKLAAGDSQFCIKCRVRLVREGDKLKVSSKRKRVKVVPTKQMELFT